MSRYDRNCKKIGNIDFKIDLHENKIKLLIFFDIFNIFCIVQNIFVKIFQNIKKCQKVVVVVVALYCHLVTSTSEISHQPAHT